MAVGISTLAPAVVAHLPPGFHFLRQAQPTQRSWLAEDASTVNLTNRPVRSMRMVTTLMMMDDAVAFPSRRIDREWRGCICVKDFPRSALQFKGSPALKLCLSCSLPSDQSARRKRPRAVCARAPLVGTEQAIYGALPSSTVRQPKCGCLLRTGQANESVAASTAMALLLQTGSS